MTTNLPKFTLHQGHDYLEITASSGMVLLAKYPDDDDRIEAIEMVRRLNE